MVYREAKSVSRACVCPDILSPPSTRVTTPTPSWQKVESTNILQNNITAHETELDAEKDPLNCKAGGKDDTR